MQTGFIRLKNAYWSTTNYSTTDPDHAWVGNLPSGTSPYVFESSISYVWPVRGGQ